MVIGIIINIDVIVSFVNRSVAILVEKLSGNTSFGALSTITRLQWRRMRQHSRSSKGT